MYVPTWGAVASTILLLTTRLYSRLYDKSVQKVTGHLVLMLCSCTLGDKHHFDGSQHVRMRACRRVADLSKSVLLLPSSLQLAEKETE